METNHLDDDSIGEPMAKRSKIETESSPTSSCSTKSESKKDEPFLSLPEDVLAKIIVLIPVDQWATLEILDEHFRASTYIAWRQLRTINLGREFFDNKPCQYDEFSRSPFGETVAMVNSILHKLAERSPFLTSLRGFELQSNAYLNSAAVKSLARFEHLQSITMGDAKFYTEQARGTPLENVIEFLESTRSRASLKELRLIHVVQNYVDFCATIRDRFAQSFVNGREIHVPLKLEKFSFTSGDDYLRIRLDTLDTTRLTDVRLGKAYVEPSQLTKLIKRASNLSRIDLSLIYCMNDDEDSNVGDDSDSDSEDDDNDDFECDGPRLRANKKLLTALASHENLTTINFVSPPHHSVVDVICNCSKCGPELIEMLKTIGRRGRLRKLGFEDYAIHPASIDMEEMCSTIHQHIPYLRSIKIYADASSIRDGGFDDIFKLTELEEMDLDYVRTTWSENVIKQIARMPHLKRLGLHRGQHDHSSISSFKYLTDAKTLTDLRISGGISCADQLFRACILDGWTEEFVSKLETLMLSSNRGDHDEEALVRLLTKAVGLRVLVLDTARITDRSLMAIAQSCPQLETLSLRSFSTKISVQCLQEIVRRCPKLKRLGGFGYKIWNQLQIPKYRNIGYKGGNLDFDDFDDDE